jgi:hypothetical protein
MSEPLTLSARHVSGFEIRLRIASLDLVDETIADLLQLGYRPAGAGDGWQRTAEGTPLCPRHMVAMRRREKQGDSWFSHAVVHPQTGESLFCRGYGGPSSPGWEVSA